MSEWKGEGMSEWKGVMCVLHVTTGVDTGVVDKEAKEYRPGFIQHFDKKEESVWVANSPLKDHTTLAITFLTFQRAWTSESL